MTTFIDQNGKPIDLPAVLAAHRFWCETDGEGGLRANLGGADLRGAYGIVILTDTDHGYRVIASRRDGDWRIMAGCRDFTIAEARAHWGATDCPLPRSGRRIIACLDWFERELENGFNLEATR